MRVKPNPSHGLRKVEERHFHSMTELGLVIEQARVDHRIKLHRGKNSLATRLYES